MKKFSSSQFRSQLNRMKSQARQAEQKLKSAVRKADRENKKVISDYNAGVRRHNQAVRQSNTKRKQAIYKINSELRRLSQPSPRISIETVYQVSGDVYAETRHGITDLIESRDRFSDVSYNDQATKSLLVDIPDNEVIETVETYNYLVRPDTIPQQEPSGGILSESDFGHVLSAVDPEYCNIWNGALFSLNPNNPDRGRQFMTSSRELIRLLLNNVAPSERVVEHNPDCEKDEKGAPTRRSKLLFLCRLFPEIHLPTFVERDINATLDLYRLLSGGTHRARNNQDEQALLRVKDRVEHCAGFIISLHQGSDEIEIE